MEAVGRERVVPHAAGVASTRKGRAVLAVGSQLDGYHCQVDDCSHRLPVLGGYVDCALHVGALTTVQRGLEPLTRLLVDENAVLAFHPSRLCEELLSSAWVIGKLGDRSLQRRAKRVIGWHPAVGNWPIAMGDDVG